MDRALELDVTEQLLDLLRHPTMAVGDKMTELPASVYSDEERWRREREVLFGELPLMAALAGELSDAGDWKLFEPPGMSIVLVRGDDGVVRGFRNACRHRGALVVDEPRGSSRSFTCPYHSWTYDRQGVLIGIPQADTFEGMCRQQRGLLPVSVQERAGVIWVLPKSGGQPFDLDEHLDEFATELERWSLGDLHFFEQRVHRVPANWKLAVDTFTEAYHIPKLHKDTVGRLAAGGLTVCTRFGRHHRQAVAMKHLKEVADVPSEQCAPFSAGAIGFVYVIFPNSVLLFFGDHAEFFQVFPGDTIDTSLTLHSLFDYAPIETDERRINLKAVFDFFYGVVGTEDYRMAAGVQRTLNSTPDETFLLGSCEAVTQAIHEDFEKLLAAAHPSPVD
jgi:phenylpropionate dioxygenase-like ring-hydroxylating dioxygenase large terminal subunit